MTQVKARMGSHVGAPRGESGQTPRAFGFVEARVARLLTGSFGKTVSLALKLRSTTVPRVVRDPA